MAATIKKQRNRLDFAKEINSTISNAPIQTKHTKMGRPSNGQTKKLTVAIPIELYNGLEVASALLFNKNKTAYINSLLKKDLAENLEKYREFSNMK